MPLDNTPLGLKLPHPDNDPYAVDVPRLRDALTLVDTLIAALRIDVDAEPVARDTAIAALVASSLTTLDTLNELAAALGDDPNFAATVATELGLKATKVELQAAVDTINAALPDVRAPTNLTPANGTVGTTLAPQLSAGPFLSLYGRAMASAQWQIATDAGFVSLVHDVTVAGTATVFTPPANLAVLTPYHWRVRHQDEDGLQSDWSNATQFTTAEMYVAAPSIVAPVSGSVEIGETPTLQTSGFSVVNGSDTHVSTDWEVRRLSDDGLVWSSIANAANKLSIVVPEATLAVATAYKVRARHNGQANGASAWGAYATFTTADAFTQIVGLSLVTAGGGGGTWARVDRDGNNFAANQTYFNQHPVFGGIVDETIGGQAMVKIPKFYYRVADAPTGSSQAGKRTWWISDKAVAGFTLHPAFMHNGAVRDFIWIGKYQATGSSPLQSVATGNPAVSDTIANFRTRAAAGGDGFMLWSIYQLAAVQMLCLVETGSGNMQSAIGSGHVSGSAAIAVNGAANLAAAYRGITGLWGNVYQFVDGLDYLSGTVRLWDRQGNRSWVSTGVANGPSNWALSMRTTSGASFDFRDIFFAETAASTEAASTYADYQYLAYTGTQIAVQGGFWSLGALAGLFCLFCGYDASIANTNIGARLARVI